MFLNCVNADIVAENDARYKAKELSMYARQRAKELAETGSSKIKPIRIPMKRSTKVHDGRNEKMMLHRTITLPMSLTPTSSPTSTPSSSSSSSLSSTEPSSPHTQQLRRTGVQRGILHKISEDLTSILKHDAITMVQEAIEKVEVSITDSKNKRSLNLELAKERLNEAYPGCSPVSNKIVALVAMDRVNAMEARIRQLENILVGLKELSANVMNDIVDGDDIDKDIKDILRLLNKNPKIVRRRSNDELLGQLTLLSLQSN